MGRQKQKIYTKKIGAILTSMALLLSLFQPVLVANAQIPQTINYQSRLRTIGGIPITATTTIQFSLYNNITNGSSGDAPGSAGPLLWKETYDQSSGACSSVQPDAQGYFFVQLGSCVSFPSYIEFDSPLYLGVKISSDAEAAPRVLLASFPYALNSQRVNSLEATTTAMGGQLLALENDLSFNIATGTFYGGGLSINGTSTLQNLTFTVATGTSLNLSNYLAIGAIRLDSTGTNNVTSGAYLVGVFDEFDNSNATTVQAVLSDLDAAITAVSSTMFAMDLQQVTDNGATTTNWIEFAGATSVGDIIPGTNNTYSIGNTDLRWSDIWGANLHVGTSTWDLAQSASGALTFSKNSASSSLTIASNGNVGIGTENPMELLDVVGTKSAFSRYSNDGLGFNYIVQKARGTLAVPLATQPNDILGQYTFKAYDGTTYQNMARLFVRRTDGTLPTEYAGEMQIQVKDIADLNPVAKFYFKSDGKMGIGVEEPTNILHVNGAITIASSTPATSTYALYNLGGDLYWNGAPIATGTNFGALNFQQATDNGATTTNSIQFAGATSVGDIIPGANNTYTLGNTDYRWSDIWGANLHVGTSTWDLAQSANGAFTISQNGGSERMRIEGNGRVGIGTNQPEQMLSIRDNLLIGQYEGIIPPGGKSANLILRAIDGFSPGTQGSAYTTFQRSAADIARIGIDTLNSINFDYWDGLSWVSRMMIDSTGNVGINTTSPDSILHLSSESASSTPILTLENDAGDYQTYVISANPNGEIIGYIGDLAVDQSNGAVYVKASGDGTDTGWERVFTSDTGLVTLDTAYDGGGSGAGRTIITDAGPIIITNTTGTFGFLSVTHSTDGEGLWVNNLGNGSAFSARNMGSGSGFYSRNQGTGYGARLDNGTDNGTGLFIDNALNGVGLRIDNAGNHFGQAIYNSADGIGLNIQNTSSSGVGLYLRQNDGHGIILDNNTANRGLEINNNGTGQGIYVYNQSSERGFQMYDVGGKTGFQIDKPLNGGNAIELNIDDGAKAFYITQNGSGDAFWMRNQGTGASLWIEDAASDSTPFVLNSAGYLGIGTSTPAYYLDVNGDARVASQFMLGRYASLPGSGYQSGSIVYNTSSSTISFWDGIQWRSVATAEDVRSSLWDTDHDTGVQVEESADEDYIRFDTAGVQRMFIQSNGRIGINTTGPLVAGLQIGQGGHMNAALSINGNPGDTGIVAFRDEDGEDIFTAMGSLANNDFTFMMGDIGNAYGNSYGGTTGFRIDQATESYVFGRARIQFMDNGGGEYVGFMSPAAVSTSTIWTLPGADGTQNGQALATDASGTLYWRNVDGAGSVWDVDGDTGIQVDNGSDNDQIELFSVGNKVAQFGQTLGGYSFEIYDNSGNRIIGPGIHYDDSGIGAEDQNIGIGDLDDADNGTWLGIDTGGQRFGFNSGDVVFVTGKSGTSITEYRELTVNGTNYVGFRAPTSVASNVAWTLPSADGANDQVLVTDGSGTLSWATSSDLAYNIYNSDGSIPDTRNVTIEDGNELRFLDQNNASTYLYFQTDYNSNGNLKIGAINNDEGNRNSYIEFMDNLNFYSDGGMEFDATSNQIDLNGQLGALSIGGDNYFTDNHLAGSRSGLKYASNYAADFVARSLVDKEYVDNKVASSTNNIYGADGDLTGDRTVNGNGYGLTLTNLPYITNFATYFYIDTLFGTWLEMDNNQMSLAAAAGRIVLNGTQGIWQDDRAVGDQRGIEYFADYSADYTDRSLVDKEYVDNAITSSTVAAGNGLTLNSGVMNLGGDLLHNTYIEHQGYDLIIREFAGEPETIFSGDNFKIQDGAYEVRFGIGGPSNVGISLTNPSSTYDLFAYNTSIGIITDRNDFLGLTYDKDYSSYFVDRSLVDKAYVDNHISAVTLQGATDNSIAADGYVMYDTGAAYWEDDGGAMKLEAKAGGYEVGIAEAGGTRLFFKSDAGVGNPTDIKFIDNRGAGDRRGIEYFADYSSDYTLRSLVDKGYVDGLLSSFTALNLQQVTDNGATTTNRIQFAGATSTAPFAVYDTNNPLSKPAFSVFSNQTSNLFNVSNNDDTEGLGMGVDMWGGDLSLNYNGGNHLMVSTYFGNSGDNYDYVFLGDRRLTVRQSSGFVGINTESPTNYLDVNGAISIASSTPATSTYALYNLGGDLYWNGSPLIGIGGDLNDAYNYSGSALGRQIFTTGDSTPVEILNPGTDQWETSLALTNGANGGGLAMQTMESFGDYGSRLYFTDDTSDPENGTGAYMYNDNTMGAFEFGYQTAGTRNSSFYIDYSQMALNIPGSQTNGAFSINASNYNVPVMSLRVPGSSGNNNITISVGTSTPEAKVTAWSGSLFTRTDGVGGGEQLYVKTTDGGNTGWVPLSASGSLADLDGDTKIQVEESSDEDFIRFDTAGTERMFITNSGDLHFADGGYVNAYFNIDNPSNPYIGDPSLAGMFLDSGNDRVSLFGGQVYVKQNFGVGVLTPNAKVDIGEGMISNPRGDMSVLLSQDGGDSFFETASGDMAEGLLMLGSPGNGWDYGVIRNISSNGYATGWDRGLHIFTSSTGLTDDPIIFSTDSAERMRILDNGRIAIGSSTASSKLYIEAGNGEDALITVNSDDGNGNGNDAGFVINSDYANGSDAAYVRFLNNGTQSGKMYSSPAGSGFIVDGTQSYDVTTNGQTRLFIAGAGNVGISTTTPGYRLDVQGDSRVSAQFMLGRYALNPASGNQAGAMIYNTASSTPFVWDGSQWLPIMTGGLTSTGWMLAGNAGTNPGTDFIGTTDNKALYFKTNNTDAMLITASGSVGIGAGVGIPSHGLEVASDDGFAFSDASGDGLMETTGSLGAGTALIQFGDIGGIDTETAFSIVPALTKFTFMHGDVGISTSSPAYRLDVVGDARLSAQLMLGQYASLPASGNQAGAMVYSMASSSPFFWDGSDWIALSGSDSSAGALWDTDHDTGIQVEESADEDIIRFDTAGTEYFTIQGPRLRVLNSGNSVFLGQDAGRVDDLTTNNNVFVGRSAGYSNTSGFSNVYIGYEAGYAATTQESTVAIGREAGRNNTGAFGNTMLGYFAGANNTGNDNVMIGYESGVGNTGGDNFFMGRGTGWNNTGNQNIMMGYFTGYDNKGSSNILFGSNAGSSNKGSNGIFMGGNAGYDNIGNDNIFLGYNTGFKNATGTRNLFLGREAGYSNVLGNGNIFLGYQAGYSETNSDRLYIDNSSTANPLIYGEFDNNVVRVNGTMQVNNPATTGYALPATDGSSYGLVLATNANGAMYWSTTTQSNYLKKVSNVLSPIDSAVYQFSVTNNNANTLTGFKAVNTNDVSNYAGAVLELKGSGADYTNNLYFGKYGSSFYVPTWAGNGVLATDKNLVLGSLGTGTLIRFQVGGGYTTPATVATLDSDSLDLSAGVSLNVGGNTLLGDAVSDTVTYNARVASNILPSVNNSYDLGSPSLSWRNIYASGTIYGNVEGYINPGYTEGSVIFQSASSLQQDNANFYWDDTANRLLLGANSTSSAIGRKLNINSNVSAGQSLVYLRNGGGGGSGRVLQIITEAGNSDEAVLIDNNGIGAGLTILNGGSGNVNGLLVDTGRVGFGTLTPVSQMQVVGTSTMRTILPEAGLTYDLGSSDQRWNNIWGANVHIGTSTWDLAQSADGSLTVSSVGSEKYRVQSNGYFGLGTNQPEKLFSLGGGDMLIGQFNGAIAPIGGYSRQMIIRATDGQLAGIQGTAYTTYQRNGVDIARVGLDTSNNINFGQYNGSWSTKVVISTSGNMGIGDTTPTRRLDVQGSTTPGDNLFRVGGGADGGYLSIYTPSDDDRNTTIEWQRNLNFHLNGSDVMVIENDGDVGIGVDVPQVRFHVTQSGDVVAAFDRTASDGTIISLRQDGAEEGTISVSANTVSYNAFTGSHYAWTNQAIEKGMLVTLTGENRYLHNNTDSEILYGVIKTTEINDAKVMGSYLSLQEPTKVSDENNPHLIMAVGNGEVWVADKGENINIGDYFISSDIAGHAEKDTGEFMVSHIVARAAESVDWTHVSTQIDGVKHKKISVFFESFDKNNMQASVAGTSLQGGADNIDATDLVVTDAVFEGNITVKGHVAYAKDVVGQALIMTGDTRVSVKFENEYGTLPIVTVTPSSKVTVPYWVENASIQGFDIVLDEVQYSDLLFNWHSFGNDEGRVYVSNGTTLDIITNDMGSSDLETQLNALGQDPENPDMATSTEDGTTDTIDTNPIIETATGTDSGVEELLVEDSQPEVVEPPVDQTPAGPATTSTSEL